MQEIKKKMIDAAIKEHKTIYPCAHREHFEDCFTISDNKILFWFNTEDQSTRVLTHQVENLAVEI